MSHDRIEALEMMRTADRMIWSAVEELSELVSGEGHKGSWTHEDESADMGHVDRVEREVWEGWAEATRAAAVLGVPGPPEPADLGWRPLGPLSFLWDFFASSRRARKLLDEARQLDAWIHATFWDARGKLPRPDDVELLPTRPPR